MQACHGFLSRRWHFFLSSNPVQKEPWCYCSATKVVRVGTWMYISFDTSAGVLKMLKKFNVHWHSKFSSVCQFYKHSKATNVGTHSW